MTFHRYLQEHPRTSPTRTVSEEKSSSETASKTSITSSDGSSCVLEGISDSPLRTFRSRSSTISGAGAEQIRKELMAQKALLARRESEEEEEKKKKKSPSPPKPLGNLQKKNSGEKMNM